MGIQLEYKASDWGWLDGQLVALDYSASVLCEEPHEEVELAMAARRFPPPWTVEETDAWQQSTLVNPVEKSQQL